MPSEAPIAIGFAPVRRVSSAATVHGSNVRRVVAQEGAPPLARRTMPLDHVLGDARLRDLKPEQFAPWMRGAPQCGFSMLIRRIKARSRLEWNGQNGKDEAQDRKHCTLTLGDSLG
jgi:hypothetical protein